MLGEENLEIGVVLALHWERLLYYLCIACWVLLNIYHGIDPCRL